jgi:hypothetical protein
MTYGTSFPSIVRDSEHLCAIARRLIHDAEPVSPGTSGPVRAGERLHVGRRARPLARLEAQP